MSILFWTLFIISILGIVTILISMTTLLSFFSKKQEHTVSSEALSLIVPIKGTDDNTKENMTTLVNSNLSSNVEYIFAMEEENDSAFEVCSEVIALFPDIDIRIVITGLSRGLMGKQHNILGGVQEAKYDIIASMDADVTVNPNSLQEGLNTLKQPNAGIAFFLPYYKGSGALGGNLIMSYINGFYNIIFTYLRNYAKAPAIIGALWMMPKEIFLKCAKDGRLANSVSDDRELGFAVNELGLETIFVNKTLSMPNENLSLSEGLSHLGKWFGMIRAEGLVVYILFSLLWAPTIWALGTVILALTVQPEYFVYAISLLIFVVLIRNVGYMTLNKKIYQLPSLNNIGVNLLFDFFFLPFLLVRNIARTTITWKGKNYKLGKHGQILSIEKV